MVEYIIYNLIKLKKIKKSMEKFFDRLGYLGISLLGMGVIGTRFIFVVDGGERAVIFNKLRGL